MRGRILKRSNKKVKASVQHVKVWIVCKNVIPKYLKMLTQKFVKNLILSSVLAFSIEFPKQISIVNGDIGQDRSVAKDGLRQLQQYMGHIFWKQRK